MGIHSRGKTTTIMDFTHKWDICKWDIFKVWITSIKKSIRLWLLMVSYYSTIFNWDRHCTPLFFGFKFMSKYIGWEKSIYFFYPKRKFSTVQSQEWKSSVKILMKLWGGNSWNWASILPPTNRTWLDFFLLKWYIYSLQIGIASLHFLVAHRIASFLKILKRMNFIQNKLDPQ